MSKINYRALFFIAESKNFSDLVMSTPDGYKEFDSNDNGKASDDMMSDVQADFLLLDLLYKFNDRQKIILMYQILRESGYNLNHEDCAKTLSITREHYMFLLKGIKEKAKKILQQAT